MFSHAGACYAAFASLAGDVFSMWQREWREAPFIMRAEVRDCNSYAAQAYENNADVSRKL